MLINTLVYFNVNLMTTVMYQDKLTLLKDKKN